MDKTYPSSEPVDFSLVLGGPLYQFFLRARLARPPLEWLNRRMIAFPLVTWLPPFLLSLLSGTAFDGVSVPFIRDITTHARFLMALPLFIAAERIIHMRLQPMIGEFTARGLIPPKERPRFDAALASAQRWRNSMVVEAFLFLFSFSVGHALWVKSGTLKTATWYCAITSEGLQLTPAGLWYAWISMPIFQFIFLRWLYRLFIWMRFLWHVSRLSLHLLPTHPDRSGGLGFLEGAVTAFFPIMTAQGILLAGVMAGQILFSGAALVSFKGEVLGLVGLESLLVLSPLCVFAGQMAASKRRALREYGALAMGYVDAFDHKWNRSQLMEGDKMLGSGDIQSLADLANSYAVVREMRVVPFGRVAILQVVAATLLPILPLVFTVVPLNELVAKLLHILL